MKTRIFITVWASLALAVAARAGFVYETPREFVTSGDFNGDGIPDVLVLDKATGNARIGYGDGAGSLTWSSALITGVENATGCAAGQFLSSGTDAVAVTSPSFNLVNLVDVSQTNAAGTPVSFAPQGLGPHGLAALAKPLGPLSGASPYLMVASSLNDSNAEDLELVQWTGAPVFGGVYQETSPFDLPNALDVNSGALTLAAGIVRGDTNDWADVWRFDTPGIAATFSNLPSGSAYVFGVFSGETTPRFVFYTAGASNLTVVALVATNGGFAFGAPAAISTKEAVEQVGFASGAALVEYSDGVQALTVVGGSPALSAAYRSGEFSGNVFTGVADLGGGNVILLDGASGGVSGHEQVVHFDGANFSPVSQSPLPSVATRATRADVWLFQQEPFVNRSPGFIASLSSPDWVDGVTGLPAAIAALTESDAGTNTGLASASSKSLGTPPAGAAFALENQYNAAISVFAYSAPRAPDPVVVTISPRPGSYGGPLGIQFSSSPANTGVRYRVNAGDAWQSYAGLFYISNNATVQYYGTNQSGARATIQTAAYTLGQPYSPPAIAPVVVDPTDTNTLPTYNSNQFTASAFGTVYYGRRSAAGAGTIWAASLDGSSDAYITDGFKPRVSPDGQWLGFLRAGGQFWVRSLQTGAETALPVPPQPVTGFEWEANDAALLADMGCGIVDAQTNGVVTTLSANSCFDNAPARNPSNGIVAWHNLSPTGNIAGIWVDGKRVISSVKGAAWPSWSSDGQNLVFCDSSSTNANDGVNLWVSAADGTGLAQISGFNDGINRFPYGALWTPDDTALVAAGTIFGTNGLWVIPMQADRTSCDGAPYRLPTKAGDPIDFAGSVIDAAPLVSQYSGPLPNLYITQTTNTVVVYWATNYTGFVLEARAPNEGSPWQAVPGPFYLNTTNFESRLGASSLQQAQWFRLHYTGAVVVGQ
jgi:hypothetical protein